MPRATPVARKRRLVTPAAHALHTRLARASFLIWGQSILGPIPPRTAGSRVLTTTIDTRGMSIPPIPTLRSPGTGRTTRAASPMVTVIPDRTTARPAVSTAVTTASWLVAPRARSSRHRVTNSSE